MIKWIKWLFDFSLVEEKYITIIYNSKTDPLEIVERLSSLDIHCLEEQYSNRPQIHGRIMYKHKYYNLFTIPYGVFKIIQLDNFIHIEDVR